MATNKQDILDMHIDDLDFSKESSDFCNELRDTFIAMALNSAEAQGQAKEASDA